ncbi:DUF2249 domain-containing protein [Halarchaeum nitratireducens]|uniref:DUF2249 domain-containing protein n=1 Tax=Halarchaeum nitratireducens TaxID=489913 RepID=A0A830GD18_9EURY|nr:MULTISPECIES: DUF2249 domain-containing protein [Halarchaeum]MBP2251023.1 uncharacterized protein (DUF2249 family) [Halarchaeum solikamskense]GGN21736.1 hypothetical protein GCM10009021_23870 [Halarchaeum nitratireducens]
MPPTERVLDVREHDGEPFDTITAALDDLSDEDSLRLVNSFEPVPLYGVLESRGFTHETEQVGEDEWHVRIEHEV